MYGCNVCTTARWLNRDTDLAPGSKAGLFWKLSREPSRHLYFQVLESLNLCNFQSKSRHDTYVKYSNLCYMNLFCSKNTSKYINKLEFYLPEMWERVILLCHSPEKSSFDPWQPRGDLHLFWHKNAAKDTGSSYFYSYLLSTSPLCSRQSALSALFKQQTFLEATLAKLTAFQNGPSAVGALSPWTQVSRRYVVWIKRTVNPKTNHKGFSRSG